MFSTIAVALDGSEAAERTLPVLRQLAVPDGTRVEIVHVQERLIGRAAGPRFVNEDELVERIKARAAELTEAGYDAHVHVEKTVSGQPAHLIAERAKQTGADLILTGTRGHGPVAGLLLGSVTARLLVVAPCPVLVVPSTVGSESDQPEVASTATHASS
jgi:nucleotide-binding universal stress UspA family protein